MQISFHIEADSLVQKVAAQGEMSTLVAAIVAAGYGAEFTSEMSSTDLLGDMDESDIVDWVKNHCDLSDLYDTDDLLEELTSDDIGDHVRNAWDVDDIAGLLDGYEAERVMRELGKVHGEDWNNAARDYVQHHELLPAGNTASNGDLLAEVLRRLTDGSMEADDVLDTLTQSGRLVIRTVYHTK